MRTFINIITEGQQSFGLDPRLDPANYKISPSLGGASRWKAKILAGNSLGEDQNVGDWDEVGYIMISLRNNTIVPIARGDEHHMGHDLLYDLQINNIDDKFLPLCLSGNYVYSKNALADLATACEKWLAWGGPDILINGSSELTGKAMYASQVAERKSFDVDPKEIAPIGQKLIAAMEKLAAAFRAAENDPIRSKALFGLVERFVKSFSDYQARTMVGFESTKQYSEIVEKIKAAKAEQNTQALEETIFGFSGIKNIMHQRVRAVMRDPQTLWADKTFAVWGSDLSLANNRLASI